MNPIKLKHWFNLSDVQTSIRWGYFFLIFLFYCHNSQILILCSPNSNTTQQHGGSIPLSQLGELMAGDDQFMQLLHAADYNKDKLLSYSEFVHMVSCFSHLVT